MAPYSCTLAWKIPWMEESGRLQSMGSLRLGHNGATSLSLFTFMRWRRKWQPTPVFLPGESQGRGSLVGCGLWGRTESDTTEVTQHQDSLHLYQRSLYKYFYKLKIRVILVSYLSSCKISQSKIQKLKTSTTYLTSIPTRQPTPVSLPRESHRQRSLVGYSPWAHKESTTERLLLTHSTRQFPCA